VKKLVEGDKGDRYLVPKREVIWDEGTEALVQKLPALNFNVPAAGSSCWFVFPAQVFILIKQLKAPEKI
jgi:hypothetical protein